MANDVVHLVWLHKISFTFVSFKLQKVEIENWVSNLLKTTFKHIVHQFEIINSPSLLSPSKNISEINIWKSQTKD